MIPRERNPAGADVRPALTPAQWSIYEAGWDSTARFRVAVCGRRFGKALALDTRLPSPDGWTTMGDLSVGAQLFDEGGRICSVVFATEIMFGRPCNRITFDDGSVIVADDEHLWPVAGPDDAAPILLTTSEVRTELEAGNRRRIASCRPLRSTMPDATIRIARRRRLLQRVSRRYGHQDSNGWWRVCGSDRLVNRVQLLCISLGLVPRCVYGTDGRSVTWHAGRHYRWREILSITRVPSCAVRCIQVDSAEAVRRRLSERLLN